nr:hypothetical protein [Tanacetum cinerariifolium]
MQEDEPAEVQEVVRVVTIAKLITEVVNAASKTVTAASVVISAVVPQVPAATITDAPRKLLLLLVEEGKEWLKSGRIKGIYMVKQRLRAGSYWNHVVEEESEVSLELLRFTRQQRQEGQLE